MSDVVGVDTLLEGDLPESASNYDGLAAFAAKTQEDWENELHGTETARWGNSGVLGALFQGLQQGKPFVVALVEAIVHQIFEDITDFFDNVGDAFDALRDGFTAKWTTVADTVSNIGTVIDGLVRGLSGWIDSAFHPGAVEQAAADIASAVQSLASTVAALEQKAANGAFSGKAVNINFGNYSNGSSLGSDWDQSYSGTGSGTLGITDGLAVCQGTWTGRFGVARYNVADTDTDYQKIGVVYATKPSMGLLGGSKSYNYIRGRANSAGDTYVELQLSANSFELRCSVSGSVTVFATVTSFSFKVGAVYWLECGTAGGARIFRVWENNRILLTYADSGAVSSVGSGFRSVSVAVWSYSSTYLAAKMAAFAFFDNTPQPILGCGWRVSRTDTSPANQSSGSNLFPASWFDTVERLTDGLTYTTASNKITVSVAGWYLVRVVQWGQSTLGAGSGRIAATLWLNGTRIEMDVPNPYNTSINWNGCAGSFVVYCDAGDELQPGYNASSGLVNVLEADSGGINTYFAGAFLGNQKPS